MKLEKAINRDRKRNKRNKMIVNGKSLFTIVEIKKKRAKKILDKKKEE